MRLRIKRRIGKLRRYLKWRFYEWLDKYIETRFSDKVKDYWYEQWLEDRYESQFESWKINALEKKAGGTFIPNPKILRVWKPNQMPSDPNEPLYIFKKFMK